MGSAAPSGGGGEEIAFASTVEGPIVVLNLGSLTFSYSTLPSAVGDSTSRPALAVTRDWDLVSIATFVDFAQLSVDQLRPHLSVISLDLNSHGNFPTSFFRF